MAPITYRLGWRSQRGATLLIALIMLVIMTLLAVSSFNMGDTNLKIVTNAQEKQRVRDISERLMNDRLHKISDGLTSDPCDMTTLAAADGSLTETLDGVQVVFSRTLLRASCVPNGTVKSDWTTKLPAVRDALAKREAACEADASSESCESTESDLAEVIAERDRAKRKLDECLRKPATTTSMSISDPTVADEAGAAEANESSYCVDVVMELRAEARDTVSKASAVIVRGLGLQCSNHDIPEC